MGGEAPRVTLSQIRTSQGQSDATATRVVEKVTISEVTVQGAVRQTRKRARKEEVVPKVENELEELKLVQDEDELALNPSSRKKVKAVKGGKRGYADPEKYAHLKPLTDYLDYDLDVLFCGINPGQKSAEIGHHFGHPTNQFWPCLFESGLTSKRLLPQEDHLLPEHHRMGLTDLVVRPTAEANELDCKEFASGVPVLLQKITQYRPHILCFVGMGIANTFRSEALPRKGKQEKGKTKNEVGLQPYKVVHENETGTCKETLFFIVPSTSGRVTRYQKTDKIRIFAQLKQTVEDIKAGKLITDTYQIIPLPGSDSVSP